MTDGNGNGTIPEPKVVSDLFSDRFAKADNLQGRDVTLTIATVGLEDLQGEDGEIKRKGILHFRETAKALVLNKTNALLVAAMFGPRLADWVGRRVTFFPTTDKLGRETVACIRVRGSPDIERDIVKTIKLPKKKAKEWTLTKTPAKKSPAPEQSSPSDAPASSSAGDVAYQYEEV